MEALTLKKEIKSITTNFGLKFDEQNLGQVKLSTSLVLGYSKEN